MVALGGGNTRPGNGHKPRARDNYDRPRRNQYHYAFPDPNPGDKSIGARRFL